MFQDQVVLITGASSGIGAELARQFAAEGASVVVTARRLDRLNDLESEILSAGGVARALACDVTQSEDLRSAVSAVREEFGRIDVVIANAGFGVGGQFSKLTVDDFRRQLDTNFFGVVATLEATLADLEESRGCFVVMGSVAGLIAFPGSSPYGASKAAAHSFALALQAELEASGVDVVLLAPGYIDSEIRQVDKTGAHHADWHDPVPSWVRMRTPRAARKMIHAIRKRRRLRIITFHGHVIAFMGRFFPGLTNWLIRRFAADRGKQSRR